ncbi:MAG: ATP-binding protein [Desulfobacterales bacterium]|nr:ATP-binding protein [Desulfobacterales bacterium]
MRQTKWCVITGAPCSGKTAVINEIEQRGIRVIHEVARSYIDQQLNKGLRLDQIKSDVLTFERHILYEKIRIQSSLPETETIFFDRGVPDSIAYYNLEGLDATEPIRASQDTRYRRIFFFERLDFFIDNVRSENEKTAVKLNKLLREAYRQSDYDIEVVPVMPVKERADKVLETI